MSPALNVPTKLNKDQRRAVSWGDGPLLIIAGAGTGKTTVITERIKHLLLEKDILPQQVLALTFTEKASREMEERVDIALPYGYSQMWISTFHSFGDRVLRNDAANIGLDTRYKLLTEAQAIRFMKAHLFDFELSYFRPLGNPTMFLSGMFQHFSRLQDEDISPTQYLTWAKGFEKKSDDPLESQKWLELARAYLKYEELKSREGMMDFSDLIYNTLKLFRERPNVLKAYQDQFKYILVDEFQDTNIAQNELIKMLAGEKANLTVVADDDQSIYKWRGAAVSNVLQFHKSYPKAKIIALTENYRSTQNVLDTAYRLIQHNNPDRLEVQEKIDKKLVSGRVEKGNLPSFIHTSRVENEAEEVAREIIKHVEGGGSYSDVAVLVRANNHSEPFTRSFERHSIPFQFLGPGQLFKTPEIKELFSYLKVLTNYEDSQSFYKVLTMEHLDISARDIATLLNYAKKLNISLFEAGELAKSAGVTTESQEKLKLFIEMVNRHMKLAKEKTAGQILYYFLEESGLLQFTLNPKNIKDEAKAQNISKFFDKLKNFEGQNEDASIYAVVDWVELSLDLGESPLASDFDWSGENAVNILTIHASKGLEFPVVFVVNLVGERFPTRERREQIPIPEELIKEVLPSGNYHLQEERRLAYVAFTRAKDKLYLTAADYYGEAKREKKLSPFIVEALGENALETETTRGEQLSILDFASPSASIKLPTSPIQPPMSHIPLPVTYLSYSQIDTFNFCPLHYKLRYITKIPTPPSAPLSFGNTLHNTMLDYHEGGKNGGSLEESELLKIYEKNWIPYGFTSKTHEEKTRERGREYLGQYL